MGFFSFITSEGKSIPNMASDRPTFAVYMVLPDGAKHRETSYAGYGVFGGKDFYEAVAEINGEEGRDAGITLQYHPPEGVLVKLPRLTEDPDKNWEDLVDPRDCPDQGFLYA